MATKVLSDRDYVSVSRIRNLPAPVASDEPVRLTELNAAIEGMKQKDPVVSATQSNINLAAPGTTVDGVTMNTGDRFLVKAQTTTSQNGIYIFNGASSTATRSLDANISAELNNALVPVLGGTNASQNWRQTAVIVTLGTDTVTFAQFGTSVAQSTTSALGTIQLATQTEVNTGTDANKAVTPATFSGSTLIKKKYTGTFGDGSATQYDFTHNFGLRDLIVRIYRNSSPWDMVDCDVSFPDANTCRLNFAAAPTTNQYNIVVLG